MQYTKNSETQIKNNDIKVQINFIIIPQNITQKAYHNKKNNAIT